MARFPGKFIWKMCKCIKFHQYHLHDNIPGNDIKFTPVLKVLEINLIAQ